MEAHILNFVGLETLNISVLYNDLRTRVSLRKPNYAQP